MSYATAFIDGYIKPFNIKEFTHRDILTYTTTNCPHKVLQHIKEIFKKEKKYLEEEKIDNKGTKKYIIKDIEEWLK